MPIDELFQTGMIYVETALTDGYDSRSKRYAKKHEREWLAILENLDTYQVALNEGAKPLQVKFGFLHFEPNGVVAIDQKGGGSSLRQTRLYVFPEVDHCILHLITIGDKTTQKADIDVCREYIKALRKYRENERPNIQNERSNSQEHHRLNQGQDARGDGAHSAPRTEDSGTSVGKETSGHEGGEGTVSAGHS
jgi:hypothetical protein